MEVKILYDRDALNEQFLTGWGVSYLVGGRVLFDTGESFPPVLRNMKALEVDMSSLETVILSHEHWDHTGGLWDILERRKGLKVYLLPDFSREFKNRIERLKGKFIEADKAVEVAKNIYTTGEIFRDL